MENLIQLKDKNAKLQKLIHSITTKASELMILSTAESVNQSLQEETHKHQNESFDSAIDTNEVSCNLVKFLENDNNELTETSKLFMETVAEKDRKIECLKVALDEKQDSIERLSKENQTLNNAIKKCESDVHKLEKEIKSRNGELKGNIGNLILEIEEKAQKRADEFIREQMAAFRKAHENKKMSLKKHFDEKILELTAQDPTKDKQKPPGESHTSQDSEFEKLRQKLSETNRILEEEKISSEKELKKKESEIHKLEKDIKTLQRKCDTLLKKNEEFIDPKREKSPTPSKADVASPEITKENFSSSIDRRRFQPRKRRRLKSGYETSENQENVESVAENVGFIQILDHDAIDGRYVILKNISDVDLDIGSWKLVHRNGNTRATNVLPEKLSLKAKSRIKLWSSSVSKTELSPNDVVLEGEEFPKNKRDTSLVEMSTFLYNTLEQLIAKRITAISMVSTFSKSIKPRKSFDFSRFSKKPTGDVNPCLMM